MTNLKTREKKKNGLKMIEDHTFETKKNDNTEWYRDNGCSTTEKTEGRNREEYRLLVK